MMQSREILGLSNVVDLVKDQCLGIFNKIHYKEAAIVACALIGLSASAAAQEATGLARLITAQADEDMTVAANDDVDEAEADEDQSEADKKAADKIAADARKEAVEAANIATERNESRLAQLQKPLSDVRVQAVDADAVTPTSRAAELLGDEQGYVMTSSGAAVSLPARYTTDQSHRPLYFEELNLERCGNTYGCATNAISGLHFMTNTVMLPYRLATMRADCPVGSHGDCQTCQSYSTDIEPFGWEPRGALVEAAAAAGFVFLLL